jgi:hypothetical protein
LVPKSLDLQGRNVVVLVVHLGVALDLVAQIQQDAQALDYLLAAQGYRERAARVKVHQEFDLALGRDQGRCRGRRGACAVP